MISTDDLSGVLSTVSRLPVITREGGMPAIPELDDIARFYYGAARQGVLLIQRCGECGHHQHYPRHLCVECGGDPEWVAASGRGVVHTYSVVRVSGFEWFREQLPYVVAMVELEEGPRMMTSITDCDVDDVYIDMPVEAYTVEVDDELGVPYWRPRAAT